MTRRLKKDDFSERVTFTPFGQVSVVKKAKGQKNYTKSAQKVIKNIQLGHQIFFFIGTKQLLISFAKPTIPLTISNTL